MATTERPPGAGAAPAEARAAKAGRQFDPMPTERQRLEQAIAGAQERLLALQHADGYWVGELEADASVAAGYIPLMYFMTGRVDEGRRRKVIYDVRSRQNEDGSWGAYYGGAGDLNVSIQVYFAMKLAGVAAAEPWMEQACHWIVAQGGVGRASVLTKVWLALFGQFDWDSTPTIPPEIILLPHRFFLNIYAFASWSRATLVALSVITTQRPVCYVPAYGRVDELYVEPPERRRYPAGRAERLLSWEAAFLQLDGLLKLWARLPRPPARRLALHRAAEWMISHQEADGSWGGIMLPWIYSLMALKSLGYPLDHPTVARGMAGIEDFILESDLALRLQPAVSPIWDTAWAVLALRESGLAADHPALQGAARWLLGKEIRQRGDWAIKNPHTEPGCWAFEFVNNSYPDLDDTPVVCRALDQVHLPGQEAEVAAAIQRASRWVMDMQCRDGGWAAFDRDSDLHILEHTPFSDFISPLDPTCADVTGHVLEFLAGLKAGAPLRRGGDYLKRVQEKDGAWYGRWGVNYIYGTGFALGGLRAAGEDPQQDYIRRAAAWLGAHQNPDGGWGESCRTYEDPAGRGMGPSTPSQTAWALIGLMAAGKTNGGAVRRGVRHLLDEQTEEGEWKEPFYTGTGFPKAFYLRYDLYKLYFPLLALGKYKILLEERIE